MSSSDQGRSPPPHGISSPNMMWFAEQEKKRRPHLPKIEISDQVWKIKGIRLGGTRVPLMPAVLSV